MEKPEINHNFNKIMLEVNEDYNEGKFEDILKKLKLAEECAKGLNYIFLGGGYIDIGSAIGDKEKIKKGIRFLNYSIDVICNNKKRIDLFFYHKGNGYLALSNFLKPSDNIFKRSVLEKVIHYYKRGLEFSKNNLTVHIGTLVNLANCYSRLGRKIKAIELYDEAIYLYKNQIEKKNQNFLLKENVAMAFANKGTALSDFAIITGVHTGTFLKESYDYLKKGLELGVNPNSTDVFKKQIEYIRSWFKDSKDLEKELDLPGLEITETEELSYKYQEFCIENKLYLNLCLNCEKRCNAYIGDSAEISNMTVSKKDFLVNDRFLKLSSYINQIKLDYCFARFLLFLYVNETLNLSFLNKNIKLVDVFDNYKYDVKTQTLKHTFKSFFDILDKIAYFINDYLELGINERFINFDSIWYEGRKKGKRKIYNKILDTQNISLNAIFNINDNFKTDKKFKELKEIRHAITHRFLNITNNDVIKKENEITTSDLYNMSIEIAKIVRNVILYLLSFVYLEEAKKGNIKSDSSVKIPVDYIETNEENNKN